MSFELTENGVQTQTVQEILDEMVASARSLVHPQLDCDATAVFGQYFGILAEREALNQATAKAIANSFTPKASGQALANVCTLTGTVKNGKTKSEVSETVTLTAGTTLPAGSRVNVLGDTTALFETVADVTNSSGITADVAVLMTAVNPGPVRAASGTLTVINTPVSGWLAATNAFDATVGKDIETDPALRVRREDELRVQGSTALSAIKADVAEVANILQVEGFENDEDVTDADGLAAHSYEIVIWDGVSPTANNNEIAQKMLDGEPAGISAARSGLGTNASGTAVDGEGANQTVLFTRALQKTLYVSYTLTVGSDYPVDGDVQVGAAAVATLLELQGIGVDVIATKLFAPAYSVAGVLDVVNVHLGFTASPSGVGNLVVGSREIAVPDTSRIVVTS